MSFDWDTANSGVLTRIGKKIKYVNSHLADATTTLPAELKAIVDQYEASDLTAIITGIYGDYDGFQSQVTQKRVTLAGYCDRDLLDRDTVLEVLGVTQVDVATVFQAVQRQAIIDSKTIQKCTVTIGSVAAGTNNGTGVVLTTKVLDGYSAPILGARPWVGYAGLDSELAVTSETMRLYCSADSMQSGTLEGAERFNWTGGPTITPLDWQTDGSGQGPSVTVSNAAAYVTDASFENWSTNTPSNWTIQNGTAGTYIFKESTNFYRGTYGVKYLGDAAQATIGIYQAVSASILKNKRRYCIAVRLKAASVPAAGQFEMSFTGTGYTRTVPVPEVQDLQISGTPGGGTYTISVVHRYGGTLTTAAIAYNATSATVQAALRLLAGLECVTVATQAGAPPDVTHRITYRGVQGSIANLTADITLLTGGAPAKTITQITDGVEGDCCILPAAAHPTTWTLAYFFINMPAVIPSDLKLVIQETGTLSAVAVYFDSLSFDAVVYHGGMGLVVVAGATRFLIGDSFSVALSNDDAGAFQTFFRKWYKAQLASSGAPSIADNLAT